MITDFKSIVLSRYAARLLAPFPEWVFVNDALLYFLTSRCVPHPYQDLHPGLVDRPAVQADVIDYDELHTGKRREAQYSAFWHIVPKFIAVPGAAIPLAALGSLGYVAGSLVQSPEVIGWLRILFVLPGFAANQYANDFSVVASKTALPDVTNLEVILGQAGMALDRAEQLVDFGRLAEQRGVAEARIGVGDLARVARDEDRRTEGRQRDLPDRNAEERTELVSRELLPASFAKLPQLRHPRYCATMPLPPAASGAPTTTSLT
ncbi:MAG: hypothetical protein HC794_04210 [Nitrospiraceae bacterium]|nr:hypothetical protein [Nitrospiraceae bacterium]